MSDRPVRLAARGLIKICGLTDEAALDAAIEAGADLCGFVFVEASPRDVRPATARRLASRAQGGPGLVGLFQNASPQDIEAVLRVVPLDMIQLHGSESAEEITETRRAFGLPVIKAVGIGDKDDLVRAAEIPADLLILDAAPPGGAAARGGHGTPFDWTLLADAPETPWLLAGGLTPKNVAEAVLAASGAPGFAGVDVSSGVEAAKGRKDPGRIARFAAAAKAAMALADKETAHG